MGQVKSILTIYISFSSTENCIGIETLMRDDPHTSQ